MIVLRYDPTFSKPLTCFLLDARTLRCRLTEASSAEYVVDLAIRWRKPCVGAIHIRPLDSECCTWVLESAVIHPDLARCQIQINDVPAKAVSLLKDL